MSAETLRRAAELMRERAKGATPGPWEKGIEDAQGGMPPDYAIWMPEVGHDGALVEIESDADHIASWHPAVALAVADWLDHLAQDEDHVIRFMHGHALTVARTYLGESA